MSSPEVNGTTRRRHQWKRHELGGVDTLAWDGDNHNGPRCEVCWYSFCWLCAAKPDRETLLNEPGCRGPHRRVWRMPDPPGTEVVAVVDRFGQVFERSERPAFWLGTTFRDDPDVPDVVLDWPTLFIHHEPLTEVSEAYEAWLAEGEQP